MEPGQMIHRFRDTLPGDGERGLKPHNQEPQPLNPLDTLPGDGERGLKRYLELATGVASETRSPVTGSED